MMERKLEARIVSRLNSANPEPDSWRTKLVSCKRAGKSANLFIAKSLQSHRRLRPGLGLQVLGGLDVKLELLLSHEPPFVRRGDVLSSTACESVRGRREE